MPSKLYAHPNEDPPIDRTQNYTNKMCNKNYILMSKTFNIRRRKFGIIQPSPAVCHHLYFYCPYITQTLYICIHTLCHRMRIKIKKNTHTHTRTTRGKHTFTHTNKCWAAYNEMRARRRSRAYILNIQFWPHVARALGFMVFLEEQRVWIYMGVEILIAFLLCN